MVNTANHQPLDLAHLHPDVHAVAGLPAAERVTRIRADRWIGYPKAVEAVDRLDTLLAWPRKQRMPNLLLVGPTNNGKSMIIEQFRRRHLPVTQPDREHIPVVSIQMPSEPSPLRFYTAILAALGAPAGPRRRLVDLEQLVFRLLREVDARILVIDELHNILAGRGESRREFLNLLRLLGNELRIPIVGVGTREAYLAVRSDDQLENRFEPFILPLWEPGEATRSLLASFAASFPLRQRSVLDTDDMMSYLLARSEGTIGELAHLLTMAAVAAVDSAVEAINQKTLAMTEYAGPTQRRRLFERELL